MSTDRFWDLFHELYEDLPRQGPGLRESTERALHLLPPLTAAQRVLDVGCGSGAQTIDLARVCEARIVAVDKHAPFLSRLRSRVAELGLGDRIEVQEGTMEDLRFPDASFDVVWSEGAIFVIGFARGLAAWRRLLVPGGYLVVSDLCWFRDDPPEELRELFLGDCPDVADVQARRDAVAASGYRLRADFVLPDAGWWESYYVPLSASLERFRAAHAGDPEALEVAARSEQEIEVYRRYPGAFGYVFFILQRDDR